MQTYGQATITRQTCRIDIPLDHETLDALLSKYELCDGGTQVAIQGSERRHTLLTAEASSEEALKAAMDTLATIEDDAEKALRMAWLQETLGYTKGSDALQELQASLGRLESRMDYLERQMTFWRKAVKLSLDVQEALHTTQASEKPATDDDIPF
jgi:chaperonin cofactor prefoldin